MPRCPKCGGYFTREPCPNCNDQGKRPDYEEIAKNMPDQTIKVDSETLYKLKESHEAIDSEEKSILQKIDAERRNLDKQILLYRKELKEIEASAEKIRAQIDMKEMDGIAELKQEKEQLLSKNTDLRQKIAEMEKKQQNYTKKQEGIRVSAEKVKAESQTTTTHISTITQSVAQETEKIHLIEEKLHTLKGQQISLNEPANSQENNFGNEIAAIQKKIVDHETSILKCKDNITKLDSDLEQKSKEKQVLEQNIKELKDKVSVLDKDKIELEKAAKLALSQLEDK